MPLISPPKSIDALKENCKSIIGKTILDISNDLGVKPPDDLKNYKGWIGQLLEKALGATASNKPEPDFEYLGIELKTIPISDSLKPLESTYICSIDLNNLVNQTWDNSIVKKKISHVLWIPIISTENLIADRKVASPIFWKPSFEELSIIRQDWHELMECLSLGSIEEVHGKLGEYLQVRPKAANSRSRCQAINNKGESYMTLPRGFYLRSIFTEKIIQQHYL